MVSISNIGLPYYNIICKIVANCCFFSLFPLSSLHESLVLQWKYYFVENMSPHSWHDYISCSHKIPFPSCPNVQYFELLSFFSHVFQTCQISTPNDILSLHSQTHNALHMNNFLIITFEHFYPRKLLDTSQYFLCFFDKKLISFIW